MPDSLTSTFAQTLSGTLWPPVLAFVAGLAVVGIIAWVKGLGLKGLGISVLLLAGISIAMIVGSAYGRAGMDVEVQSRPRHIRAAKRRDLYRGALRPA
jgi:hypothetical protein